MKELCEKYDELYDTLSDALRDAYYTDMAICDELSASVHGSLPHAIDNSYLPFFEHVISKSGYYDGGYSATELLNFVNSSVLKANTSFSLVAGLEAPLSLITIYLIKGKLESAEYFFARDIYEAEDVGQCAAGYKIGIGFDGKDFSTLKFKLSTGKITKSIWTALKSKDSNDDFKIVKGVLKKYTGNQKKVVIPDTVKTIGKKAFMNRSKLEEVIVSNSVKTIDDEAFRECTMLKSVSLPDSLVSIGVNAFRSCSSLTSLVLPSSLKSIDGFAFGGCPIESIVIPDGISELTGTFRNCTSLSNVVLPEALKGILHSTFSGCKSLKNIVIPQAVTNIGILAFEDCTSLTSIIIPEAVTNIGSSAFAGCTSLKNITIPKNVKRIGRQAFWRCSRLKKISYDGTIAAWHSVKKEEEWNAKVPAKEIKCSDGIVEL